MDSRLLLGHRQLRQNLSTATNWGRWARQTFRLLLIFRLLQQWLCAPVCCLCLSRLCHVRYVGLARSPFVSPTATSAWCLCLRRTARHVRKSSTQPTHLTVLVRLNLPRSHSLWRGQLCWQQWIWVLAMLDWWSSAVASTHLPCITRLTQHIQKRSLLPAWR